MNLSPEIHTAGRLLRENGNTLALALRTLTGLPLAVIGKSFVNDARQEDFEPNHAVVVLDAAAGLVVDAMGVRSVADLNLCLTFRTNTPGWVSLYLVDESECRQLFDHDPAEASLMLEAVSFARRELLPRLKQAA